jgi:Transposase DDE domain
LPEAMQTEAELEGAYRLLNNRAIDPQQLFDSLALSTVERAQMAGTVLVIHDTTSCTFEHTDPAEVGYLSTGKAGFYPHFALVLDASAWKRPLGVVHVETISRKQRSKRGRKNKAAGSETAEWQDRESARWERGVTASAELLASCKSVCHIADRESDSYALLASMTGHGHSFVVRVNHNRKVGDPEDLAEQWLPLRDRVKSLCGVLEREVVVSERKRAGAPRSSKGRPVRNARTATLSFSATSVVIKRPSYIRDPIPKTLTLNVVHVSEPNPPAGEPPVEWLLFTTLPVDSAEQVATVVDNYRARWTIEEFNKALKTGCAYESREFETLHALLMLLAISLPIACELLWLRSRARTQPHAPATEVVTKQQIQILRTLGARALPPRPTVYDALWAVAGIGGHQKRNGEPGWLVLYRGMRTLLTYEAGYEAGRAAR